MSSVIKAHLMTDDIFFQYSLSFWVFSNSFVFFSIHLIRKEGEEREMNREERTEREFFNASVFDLPSVRNR